jgi:GDPmannose 4,6-dehydratase
MKALITGVNGQTGSYLAELLIDKGYEVIGVRRRSATGSLWRLSNIINHSRFSLVEGDVTDYSSCLSLILTYKPDEIYNLAAQSHVGTSFSQPGYTFDSTAKGVLNLLEVIRLTNSKTKFYQASSSEMFGTSFSYKHPNFNYNLDFFKESIYHDGANYWKDMVQNENTKFEPQSPYAIAKLAAHNLVKLYREAYGIYAVGGILFNHESPRRGVNFVTRKITSWFNKNVQVAIDKVKTGWPYWELSGKLKLGNLDSCRDWGYAKEYVEAMWLMLQQQQTPKDYVIGTGETHTVKEFLQAVINYYKNYARFSKFLTIEDLVDIDDNCKRPAEVPYLKADASLAAKELGWKPKTSFNELVEIMCRKENGQP